MYIFVDFKFKVTQSCPTLCNPMDYTVHGILQVTILELVAFPFSGWSSQPRDQTQVSRICGIQRYIHIHVDKQKQWWKITSQRQIPYYFIYMQIWKKKDRTNKKACRYREEIGGWQRWGVGGRQKWMKGVKRYKLPVVKQMSPGISGQCYCAV